jgi:ATP-dependent helicase HrpA
MTISRIIEKIDTLLQDGMLRDRAIIARRLENLLDPGKHHLNEYLSNQLVALKKRAESSVRDRARRAANVPVIQYPEELPIYSRRRDILKAVSENQIVIISGETGSGKSTQIPKMCLEAGRGIAGKIGCTQPRRIAASTISRRIAEELGEDLGKSVGYKIRFQDKTPRSAYIKIMTDGMLLAETQGDPLLYEYDTLIIDEAHERSLNIDFILGIVRNLLPKRPELKVIITSATIDTQKFSEAFNHAPVIEVSGRLFPVEVEYSPMDFNLEDEGEITYIDLAVDMADRLHNKNASGDILIFMPTEQDIIETCERLEGRRYPGVAILPLFARLPSSRQGMIYSVRGPKIVVATNVAETSLTIPGIRYVIDTGLARIAQYLPRTRTNSLPVSPISRSSADQRKGRCGRVRNGVCIRLYSEKDYEERPQFTPPEILRSSLAEVILRMIDLKMGDPLSFPFIDPPNPRSVKDGFDLLQELGAVEKRGEETVLTEKGRLMARMPVDPRISRMMIEAVNEGYLEETAVIAAALSIQDPRERPVDKAAQADQALVPFKDQNSDFLTLLNIWNRYHREWEGLKSQGKMRKFCKAHFLSFPRMREWIYTHNQIMDIVDRLEMSAKTAAGRDAEDRYAGLHRPILSGFLSNIAMKKDKGIYQATRGREVMIFPGSTLFKKNAEWIIASEIVKTSRLYARNVARIDPAWLEAIGGDLCKLSYAEPHWEKNRGEVMALEKVTLFGLTIIQGRPVSFGKINPIEAHEIFISSGLVQGEIKPALPFLKHNAALIKKMEKIEDKLRRRDIMVGEDTLAEFYSKRLQGVSDVRTLTSLIKQRGGDQFLRMKEEDLLHDIPDSADLSMFPDEVNIGGARFKTVYRFSPGKEEDGVTIRIPSSLAGSVRPAPLEWGVPGMFREKVTAILKALPKTYRKQMVPISSTVDIVLKEMKPSDQPLIAALSRFVYQRFKMYIPAEAWNNLTIPSHLLTRISIMDDHGQEIRSGRDISQVLEEIPPAAPRHDASALKQLRLQWEKEELRGWDIDGLPENIPLSGDMLVYPGLEALEGKVNMRLFLSKEEALTSHKKGVKRLLAMKLDKDLKLLKRNWPLPDNIAPAAIYFGGKAELEKSMLKGVLNRLLLKDIRGKEEFEACAAALSKEIFEEYRIVQEHAIAILKAFDRTRSYLNNLEAINKSNQAVLSLCTEIRSDMSSLVPHDFPEIYAPGRMTGIPRYLRAMEIRAERGANNPGKDRIKAELLEIYVNALRKMADGLSSHASMEKKTGLDDFRWMIEEFKVSIFAQELGTAFPVSAKRLDKLRNELERIV